MMKYRHLKKNLRLDLTCLTKALLGLDLLDPPIETTWTYLRLACMGLTPISGYSKVVAASCHGETSTV